MDRSCRCISPWPHNPTQLNRQGPDVGTQYRSVIFYANEAQKKVADELYRAAGQNRGLRRTHRHAAAALQGFYPAEGYHQDYLLLNPTNPYIVYNDLPKIRNFQKLLPVLYQAKAVTVTGLSSRDFPWFWLFWRFWVAR